MIYEHDRKSAFTVLSTRVPHERVGRHNTYNQGRPINVKHDARCVMVKVGGEQKGSKQGGVLNL